MLAIAVWIVNADTGRLRMDTDTIKQYQEAFANLDPEQQAQIREKLERQYAECVIKETNAKMVADIGPMLASGASGSVAGDAIRLFSGGNGSAGQAGGSGSGSGSISLGGE